MGLEQRLSQSLKLGQKLVMTPQLQLAIKLLPMTSLELKEAINQELMENPLLEELDEPDQTEKQLDPMTLDADVAQVNNNKETMELEDFVQNNVDNGGDLDGESDSSDFQDAIGDERTKDPEEKQREELTFESKDYKLESLSGGNPDEEYERPIVYEESLNEYLLQQLHVVSKDDKTIEIGTEIIGDINDEGYLESSVEEIGARIHFSNESVLNTLKLIQTFDPNGVGARTLQECFLLQLEPYHDMADLAEIVIREYLNELSPKNLKKLAQELDCSMDEMVETYNLIKTLDPKPGLNYTMRKVDYITPDVTVVKHQDQYVVFLNNDDLPFLKVSESYDDILAMNGIPKAEKDFILDKKRNANWFIRCIEQRKSTILKASQCIVNFQAEFFDKGISYLKPMVLKDVAEEIGMHESTISRVTTNKYMQTPLGVFEFKYFFHSRVDSHLGNDISSLVVKELLKKLIAEESKEKPLTDIEIVDELAKKDVKIARRTVAKYRAELRIPPTSQRKNYF